MRTFITLSNNKGRSLPSRFQGDDVRFTQSLISYFLQAYTKPNALVLDPFAGYGTTLVVADRMGRCGIGGGVRYC